MDNVVRAAALVDRFVELADGRITKSYENAAAKVSRDQARDAAAAEAPMQLLKA